MYVCTYVCLFVCVFVCVYVCVGGEGGRGVRLCRHASALSIHVDTHIYMYIYIHIYIYIYIYICIVLLAIMQIVHVQVMSTISFSKRCTRGTFSSWARAPTIALPLG